MPLDLTFGRPGVAEPGLPWGWNVWPLLQTGHLVALDRETSRSGAPSLRIERPEGGEPASATYRLWRPVGAGGRLTLRGWMAGAAEPGVLGLTARRVSAEGEYVIVAEAFSSPAGSGAGSAGDHASGDAVASGMTSGSDVTGLEAGQSSYPAVGWRRVETSIDVPADADMIDLVLRSTPAGPFWIADLELLADGARLADTPGEPRSEAVAAIGAAARRLAGANPEAVAASLEALTPILGDARILLLGESTHGTREFQTVKHGIVRALVEAGERVVVALEDHHPAMAAIDVCVRRQDESCLDAAMDDLFAVWSTTEMRAFWAWAAALPDRERERVRFAGVDMQHPGPAIEAVLAAFAARETPARAAPRAAGLYGEIEETLADPARLGDAARVAELAARARAYGEAIENRETRYLARIVAQGLELSHARDPELRAASMAENLVALSTDHPEARIVFWGHNGHVRRSPGGVGDFLAQREIPATAVALLTYRGRYSARWPRDGVWRPGVFDLYPAPARSVERLLHDTGLAVFAVALDDDRVRRALASQRVMRSIGGVPEDYGFTGAGEVWKSFDALLFVDETGPVTPR